MELLKIGKADGKHHQNESCKPAYDAESLVKGIDLEFSVKSEVGHFKLSLK
jgi:hypothetical protein